MTEYIGQLCSLISGRDTNADAPSGKDWDRLAETAQTEGVAPIIFWHLSKSGKLNDMPESARRAFRAAYAQAWKNNQSIFNEMEMLVRGFSAAKIPVVALKGACFALTIYPDPGTRPMSDLDLLVPAARLNEAARIAKSFGYVNDEPEASPGLDALLGHSVNARARGVTLEIHHSLVADKNFTYAVPVDWFWTQTAQLNNPRFAGLLVLSPAAQLLYASAHAMLQHGGKRAVLRWFADMDLLIRHASARMDWGQLLEQARIFEWSSALRAALNQTQEYFDTPIPEDVLAELSRRADRHMGLVEQLKEKPRTHMQEELQKMSTLNAYGRLRLLLGLVFPSAAYMRKRYGLGTNLALLVYYPLRWWDIFVDGLRTLAVLRHKKSL